MARFEPIDDEGRDVSKQAFELSQRLSEPCSVSVSFLGGRLIASLPAGTTCTGGPDGASCLVAFKTTANFGNCVLITTKGDSGSAAAAPAAAASSGNTTSTSNGKSNNSSSKNCKPKDKRAVVSFDF